MKRTTRILALLLAVLMFAGLAAGCGDSGSQTSTAPSAAPSKAPDTTDPADEGNPYLENDPAFNSADILGPDFALPGNVPPTKLPLVDGGVTLEFWSTINSGAVITTLAEGEMWKEAMNRTGVNLTFIHPSGAAINESFQLLIASQVYPDILAQPQYYIGGIEKAVEDEVFLLLNDYEAQAPHFFGLLNADEALMKDARTDSGYIGLFSNIMYTDVDMSPNGMTYRKDITDGFGITKMPETFAEWESTLTTLKDEHDFPGALLLDQTGAATFNSAMLTGLGLMHNYVLRNGKIEYARIAPEYKQYLTYMADWYAKGLIYQDFYTVSSMYAAIQELAANDKVIFLNGWSAFSGDFWAQTGQAANPNNFLAAIKDPVEQAGTKPMRRGYGEFKNFRIGGIGGHAIIATSEYKEVAVRFMDYFYSSDGSLLSCFGPWAGAGYDDPNATYYLREDGRPMTTALVSRNETLGLGQSYDLYSWHMPPLNFYQRELDGWTPDQYATLAVWGDTTTDWVTSPIPPNYSLTFDESSRATTVMADIQTYVDEMTIKFIIGAESIDAKWDEYVSVITNRGVDEAMSLHQAAVDRYLAR